jgi:signal-transduction protein with cAMP-binding, CBS, and nucleotidyltransferase domain
MAVSEIGLRTRMLVKDVMSSPVITVEEKETVDRVAQHMDTHQLGCIIVTDKEGKPIGIITEKDLISRVLAKNRMPSRLKAKTVMTTPLITISPDETLSNVARQMSRLNVRRLGVLYKGDLVGVISSKDVLAVTPELLETIQEKARIESGNVEETSETAPMTGYCDRCSQWSTRLKEVEGEFLCDDCRVENQKEY